ncbi:MAG: hypothetical protein ACYS26_04770 [Planctomycetota bacterium]|jgi:hypothetical protein
MLFQKSLQLADGIELPSRKGLREGYAFREPSGQRAFLQVNVHAPRMSAVVADLFRQVAGPGFFILELPCDQQVEERLRTQDTDPLHRDIYYLSPMDAFGAAALLSKYERPLIHDGGVMFGYASQDGRDEVFIAPYKVVTILTHEPRKFVDALLARGLKDRPRMRSAHDNLGLGGPGRRGAPPEGIGRRLVMLDELMRQGLQHVGRRGDDVS